MEQKTKQFELADAVGLILGYLAEEEQDFEEHQGSSHIYHAIAWLRRWLDEGGKS